MRTRLLLILNFLFLALASCTSLNNKCDYLPPGDCWTDVDHCMCNPAIHKQCGYTPPYVGMDSYYPLLSGTALRARAGAELDGPPPPLRGEG